MLNFHLWENVFKMPVCLAKYSSQNTVEQGLISTDIFLWFSGNRNCHWMFFAGPISCCWVAAISTPSFTPLIHPTTHNAQFFILCIFPSQIIYTYRLYIWIWVFPSIVRISTFLNCSFLLKHFLWNAYFVSTKLPLLKTNWVPTYPRQAACWNIFWKIFWYRYNRSVHSVDDFLTYLRLQYIRFKEEQ